MDRKIKKITAILLASAGAITLGEMIGSNSIKSTTPTIVRAADSVATIRDRNGNTYSSIYTAYSALPNGGEIYISEGTLTAASAKTTFSNGMEYLIIVEGNVTITSNAYQMFGVQNNTAVSFVANNGTLTFRGSGNNNDGWVFYVPNGNLSLKGEITFDGIRNSSCNGVAIRAEQNSTLDIDGCTFNNCLSSTGGAVFSENTALSISNAKFTNNTAGIGGALRINGGTATIDNSNFADNTATATPENGQGASGGAIAVYGGASVTIASTIIERNHAVAGCGIHLSEGDVVLNSGTEIRYNDNMSMSTKWGAGAAYVRQGTLTMNDGVSLHHNEMYGGGTVIIRQTGATFVMNGGEIYNNKANMTDKTNSGAAVILSQEGAGFIMNGGSIHDNYSAKGAAVSSEKASTVELNGGAISGNTNANGTEADIDTNNMAATVDVDSFLSNLTTKVNLSLGYEIDDDDTYSFYVNTNSVRKDGFVGIRFGAMIPVGKWNMIKANVKSIGVEYSKLGAPTATKEVLKENVVFANEDGTDVGNAYAAYTVRMIIDLADKEIESSARAFVRKTDDSLVYLGDARTYSVKTLSEFYISNASSLGIKESTLNALEALIK